MDNSINHSIELVNLPYGTVVIDCDGDAWQKADDINAWTVAGYDAGDPDFYIEEFFPVKVVYTPDET